MAARRTPKKPKACNVRVLLFTRDGVRLDVPAKDVLELRSYTRLAMQNLKPMTRQLGQIHGAVITLDLDAGTTHTVWSRLGRDIMVGEMIVAWFKKNASKQMLVDWLAKGKKA